MSRDYDYDMRLSLNSLGFKNPRSVKKPGIKFSPAEAKELLIAILVLTLAFSFAFSNRGILFNGMTGVNITAFLVFLPISLLAVATAFALHELSHKVIANIYGYPAAFSYSRSGLIWAVLLSVFFGFLIAAPGAVFIYGYPTKKENGIISMAGPLSNLIIGIGAFAVGIAFAILSLGFLASAFIFIAFINLFLGAFNLIPLMPLDGAKIWKWNKPVYITMAIILFPSVILWMWLGIL